MEYKDYYKILGVGRKATTQEIQKAYRKLARKYHPDVNKDPAAEVRFKEIGEAYEVLKDDDKRERYDRYGSAWKQAQKTGSPPPGWENMVFDFGDLGGMGGGQGRRGGRVQFDMGGDGDGFSSFFDMLFGNRGRNPSATWQTRGASGRRGGRGRDRETSLALSLEDLASGGSRRIELTDPNDGSSRTLDVTIPQGLRAGKKIRLSGQGEPGPGGAGDLFLTVDIAKHRNFRLEGDDLYTTLEVTPWEAALGARVPVHTLNGEIMIQLPPGSSSGRKIRLRGKGMPWREGTADLFAEVRIVVPEELTEEQRALYVDLAALDGAELEPEEEKHQQTTS